MRLAVLVGIALGVCVPAAWWITLHTPAIPKERLLARFEGGGPYAPLTIRYPLHGTLFPPEIIPPTFRWEDRETGSDAWGLGIAFQDDGEGMSVTCSDMEWTPSDEEWEAVKRRSRERPALVTVLGVHRESPNKIVSAATITIATSNDPVGAPIFYREVDLPFITSVRDPASHIRWRFGEVSSKQQPPIVLDRLPVCANCHSFSADGKIREQFLDDSYYARSGNVLRYQGDHEIAVRDFRKALEWNPKNVEALVGMGASLRQMGEKDEAKAFFLRAIEVAPTSAPAHEGLGNLLAQQGRFQEAADCLREALRLDPALASAHFRLGVVLLDLNRLEDAKRHLAEAVRLEPTVAQTFYALGAVLSREGKPSEAAAQYRRALRLDSNLVLALADLASILATSSDPSLRNGKEAVELATRASDLTHRQDPGIQLVLSEAYAEAGRLGDAVFVAERVLQTASAQGDPRLIGLARSRLECYRLGKPFRNPTRP